MNLKGRNFLTLKDFTPEEILYLIELAADLKAKKKEAIKAVRGLKKAARQGNPEERRDRYVQREIQKFRKDCSKDPDNKNNIARLKALVTSIFTKNPEQIVLELPNLFIIIRGMLIVGATAINPIVGLITFITSLKSK